MTLCGIGHKDENQEFIIKNCVKQPRTTETGTCHLLFVESAMKVKDPVHVIK